jgi:hypothetical protein
MNEHPIEGEAVGNELKDPEAPPRINALTWRQTSRVIAATEGGAIRVWDPPVGAVSGSHEPGPGGAPTAPLLSIACTPDLCRIVTGDKSGRLQLWRAGPEAAWIYEDVCSIQVHRSEVRGVGFLDENTIVSASRDWNLALVDWTKAWNRMPDAIRGPIHVSDEICSFATGKDAKGPFVLVGTYRGTILKLRFDDVK